MAAEYDILKDAQDRNRREVISHGRPTERDGDLITEQALLIIELGNAEILTSAVEFLHCELIPNCVSGKATTGTVGKSNFDFFATKIDEATKIDIRPEVDLLGVARGLGSATDGIGGAFC
jgi:hypothetical protein